MTPSLPFRAEQVGSLLRPPELHDARAQHKAGAITRDQLRAVEDRTIREAVAKQEAIGLQVITDGEFRRDFWHLDFLAGIDGIGMRESTTMRFQGAEEIPPTPIITGRIRRTRPNMVDHFTFLAGITRGTPKFTIPAPSMAHLRGGTKGVPRDVYPDLEMYWHDLAMAYRKAIAELGAAGCTYLQLDDITFAYLADEKVRQLCRAVDDDPDTLPARFSRTIREAVADRPAGMTIAMHTCRGNFRSTWVADTPYETGVTEAMFACGVDAFFMEFDNERAGGFDVLKALPADKKVVLGLVTTKLGALEDKDTLKRRIDAAAKIVPLERLCLSPQCGFASTHHGNKLSYDEQWRKLERVVEVAREVWK